MTQRNFTFLGTGTSVGIPMIGCDCAVCTSTDPHNSRYRCAVLIGLPKGNLLIDTPPELRLQLIRAKVKIVHAVLYTHFHADHVYGLDDLRPIPRYLGSAVPLYCTHEVERKIRQSFAYAFAANADSSPAGFLPKLVFRNIDETPFEVLGERVTPISLIHAQALRNNCLSNLRQLATGMLSYANTYNGRLPNGTSEAMTGLCRVFNSESRVVAGMTFRAWCHSRILLFAFALPALAAPRVQGIDNY